MLLLTIVMTSVTICIIAGLARLNNVEFYHSGQEGWTDYYDPRFSIAFLDIGPVMRERPSYIEHCAFHHGFSPAIGVFGTQYLNITNNVVHHTVGSGTNIFHMDSVNFLLKLFLNDCQNLPTNQWNSPVQILCLTSSLRSVLFMA